MKTIEELEDANVWVLTAVNGVAVFMRKDSPHYKPKQNDRIVSEDCVLANEPRLTEVTDDLHFPTEWGAFALDA
tara:strand:+ start:215 stop:436 length:222 start_codon:yes stop_codon:yes gene_type:complete